VIEVFREINALQPRPIRGDRGYLGNLDTTSPKHLGYKLLNLFITSDTSAIAAGRGGNGETLRRSSVSAFLYS
jgi:hypothetical protein